METISESDIITRFFAPLAGEGGFGLTDDAALVECPTERQLVVTVDTVTSGIDFFEDAAPEEVAAKALRVNLSDLAAKGAAPIGYLLALSLPEAETAWLEKFSGQLRRDQKTYDLQLLGGDTTKAPLLSVTITALGIVPTGKMVRRTGAKPGDFVCVTGTIGDAALGLQALQGRMPKDGNEALIERYRFPRPRSYLSPALRNHASAAIDVSDGLVGDLTKLCQASNVTAEIALEYVPHSKEAAALIAQDERWRDTALTGGDDYEVLFTLPSQMWLSLLLDAQNRGIAVKKIGEILAGSAPPRFTLRKEPRGFAHGSYQHFSKNNKV